MAKTTTRYTTRTEEAAPSAQQESMLAVLIFSPRGAELAARLKPEHFDSGPLFTIAEGVLEYWRRYAMPPGSVHMDDLFADAIRKGKTQRLVHAINGLMA